MPAIRITDADTGETYVLDTSRVMFSEADLLEREWGLKMSTLKTQEILTDLRSLAAFIWLLKVRARAAERGLAFRKAAEDLAPADFDFNLAALSAEVEGENPTDAPTSGPATRTRRGASAKTTTPYGTEPGTT